MKRYDVAVIGGGFAGFAAAVAASRSGAQVILVEKGNSLGGAAVNCLVTPFMPYKTKINGQTVSLSAGIFREIQERLMEKDALLPRPVKGGESFLEEELKFILQKMAEEAGVSLLYHAYVCGAEQAQGKITAVRLATKCGEMTLEADLFVDATGDAQLAYLAECPTVLGRPRDHLCQPMTLCFRLGNVDVDRFFESCPNLQERYKEAQASGEIKNPRENVLVFRTPVPNVLHFNTTRVVRKNPTSPEEVTAAELEARRQVHEICDFMKKHAKGLENSFLMMTASEIGVRESRMIVGDYVLTEADCRAFRKFEDGIAACNYDIDIHNPEGSGTSHYYFPEGEYYTIPYRSLIPRGSENMLVAGRCISSDHGAQASYRIMPVVCCLGEAAGYAAALALKQDCEVRRVNTDELRRMIRQNGGFLG